jgi:hypothetical protein
MEMEMDFIIKLPPKSVSNESSRIVHQGGEAPSFGPVRKPK